MSKVEIKVPDIGDFHDVDVIEVLVAEGDTITAEQSLITVETDKASMEIPATQGGKVTALKIKVGDKVSQGTVLLEVEADAGSDTGAGKDSKEGGAEKPSASPDAAKSSSASADAKSGAGASAGAPASSGGQQAAATKGDSQTSAGGRETAGSGNKPAPTPAKFSGQADIECDMVVLGAGPGGYSAAFRAADLGMNVVLVERYATLGGVCRTWVAFPPRRCCIPQL
mgnify:FL=1